MTDGRPATLLETGLGRVELRELRGLAELGTSEALQRAVWGEDTLPDGRELLLAVQQTGGLVGGAFGPAGELAGMVFGFPTRDPALQHSHRLAVLPAWRGQGLGAALKWFQRSWCLERGITRVEWTVDPLRMPNAQLNAEVLGAGSSVYYLDYYGAMQGIDAGLPSDRLLMEWRLDSPRVQALADGTHPRPLPPGGEKENMSEFDTSRCQIRSNSAGAEPANRVEEGRPLEALLGLDAPRMLLALPENFTALTASDPALALEWRLHARQLFQHYFERGYAVRGFTRLGGPAYILDRIETPR